MFITCTCEVCEFASALCTWITYMLGVISSSTPFRQYSQLPWRFIAMMCSIQMNECESAHHSQDISVWSLISCMLLFAHSSQRPKHPLIASAMDLLIIIIISTSSNPEIHIVWCYNDMCSLCSLQSDRWSRSVG